MGKPLSGIEPERGKTGRTLHRPSPDQDEHYMGHPLTRKNIT